jgi:hypothetical protein
MFHYLFQLVGVVVSSENRVRAEKLNNQSDNYESRKDKSQRPDVQAEVVPFVV